MLLPTLCVLAALTCLVLAGSYNEAVITRGWEGVLGPESTEVYERVRDSVEAQTLLVQASYRGAAQQQAAGAEGEALHLIELGVRSVEAGLPTLLHLNRGILALSRHAGALGPVPALRLSAFGTPEMRGLAALHAFLHRLLVTMRERLSLRLLALSCGVRAVCRLLISSSETALDDPDAGRWGRMEALSADFGALGRESLETLRIVLASLSAGVLALPSAQPSRAR
jgi:hypothetical protein